MEVEQERDKLKALLNHYNQGDMEAMRPRKHHDRNETSGTSLKEVWRCFGSFRNLLYAVLMHLIFDPNLGAI